MREGEILAGKYRVDRVLAAGGMGIVVAATHLELDQRVALKFVLPSAAGNAGAVDRFLREARAAARLRSEHVAKVLDVGKMESGQPYMVMEYLEGADLAGVLQRARDTNVPITPSQAADFVIQASEALAEAHSLGIIHRDLKPQNLFLTHRAGGDPLIKVLDFGISKLMNGLQPALTQTSTLIGSPLYMAPEQMRSAKSVDPRTDIWALGIVLYELLSGKVPFEADTVPELCLKVVNDAPVNLATLRRDIHPGLASVVARCLEKEPAYRFQTAAELATALEPYASPVSHVTAEHARRITSGLRSSAASFTPDGTQRAPSSPGTPAVFQGTIAFSDAPSKHSRLWMVAGVVLLMGIGAVGTLLVKHRLLGPASSEVPAAQAHVVTPPPAEAVRPENRPVPDPLAATTETKTMLAAAAPDAGVTPATVAPVVAPVVTNERRGPSPAARPPFSRAAGASPPVASTAPIPAPPRTSEPVAPVRDDEIPSVR